MQIVPENSNVESLLVNPKVAARMLAIGSRKLWSLTNCGDIRCVRIGRAVRYDRRDLLKFIDSRKNNRRHAG